MSRVINFETARLFRWICSYPLPATRLSIYMHALVPANFQYGKGQEVLRWNASRRLQARQGHWGAFDQRNFTQGGFRTSQWLSSLSTREEIRRRRYRKNVY